MLQSSYLEIKKGQRLPRLPLEGNLDLTYRCDDDCRHCWLRIPPDARKKKDELSFEEIRRIADEAKAMGCRRWSISGGEPMLRPDFAEIFDYLTRNSLSYSLNTNGTRITPKIAQLMKRKGVKMVALYGATAEIHDHITRNPGSFESTMRGFSYLKEAEVGFIVQLIPMKDNYHQFKDMVKLAESLSKHYRVGAVWLFLSACGDKQINAEIMRQRLPPKEVVELNKPDLSYEEGIRNENYAGCHVINKNEYLFSSCTASRRDFHVDPYGKMTSCCFIKDPSLRYDLRKGNFQDCWDNFIPSLATRVKATQEYKKNCGSCELRKDCLFCPAHGYLEHRDFSKKVEYLCAIARENLKFKDNWRKNHRRYFKIADITIQVESDLAFAEDTFHPKFKPFQTDAPGEDAIRIRHHFSLPDLEGKELGTEVYRKNPWAIYKNEGSWTYLEISRAQEDRGLSRVAIFNSEHTRARIYNNKDIEEAFHKGNLNSLTLFASDQILLARVLADRQGFYLHSCGVIFKGKGLLFVGHSEAGKSTMATLLKGKAEILCDDRIIIRKTPSAKRYPLNAQHKSTFRIYGTWSHGDVADVSSACAPLSAILFLEKAEENQLIPVEDKKEVTKRILSCLIKPFVTMDWWEKTLSVVDDIVQEIPCYILKFDKNGGVAELLKKL